MRLVCPKCAAQYEVDESAIPESGRDVQCANCGDTWFQTPAAPVATEKADPDPAPAEEAVAAPPPANRDEDAVAAPGQQVKSDSSVLDILRREAELDAAARSGMPVTDGPEPDEDMAAEFELSAMGAARQRRRLHLLTPEEEEAVAAAAVPPATTSEPALTAAPKRQGEPAAPVRDDAPHAPESGELPDVDSLNSTLRSADDKSRAASDGAAAAPAVATARQGGRLGFSLAVLLAVALFAIYSLAPRIEAAFPATGTYLEQYVAAIDLLRLRFADGVASLFTALKGIGG